MTSQNAEGREKSATGDGAGNSAGVAADDAAGDGAGDCPRKGTLAVAREAI
ncbi:hypothetical protein [Streptomyces sp. MI02-7b]|uniref:hypothetical protein n=1 Tax=Streptomyces sp. MI02-7b TaxID=462941 RepID=UPI0029A4705C|nr:hypothetical protein [Streptomyces sp. MI02-7b]MDX3078404.1 hypothetical protein [Streptomyces sp. MI02-7b]